MAEKTFSLKDLLVSDRNSIWEDRAMCDVRCPLCGYVDQDMGLPALVPGEDNYKAGWGGRGDLIVIPMKGYCGHKWDICFGFHKGRVAAFARVFEP